MSERITKPVDDADYHHCCRCMLASSVASLSVYPHRRFGKLVGWVLLCDGCAERVVGTGTCMVWGSSIE